MELMVEEEMRKLVAVTGANHAPVFVGGRYVLQYFPERADLRRRWVAEAFVDARLRDQAIPSEHTVSTCTSCGERVLNLAEPVCALCAVRDASIAEQAMVLDAATRAWAPDRASFSFNSRYGERYVLHRHHLDGGSSSWGGGTPIECALRASLNLGDLVPSAAVAA